MVEILGDVVASAGTRSVGRMYENAAGKGAAQQLCRGPLGEVGRVDPRNRG